MRSDAAEAFVSSADPRRNGTRGLARLALIVVFVALSLAYLAIVIYRKLPASSGPIDFLVYYQAAAALNAGRSPYGVPGFIYPPAFATMLRPLALLPPGIAAALWFLLSLGSLLLSVRLLLGVARIPRSPLARWTGALFCLSPPVVYTLVLGQINLVLLALFASALALGLRAPSTGAREARVGLLLGCAAAIKVYPAALGLALLASRRIKAAVAMFLGALLFTLGDVLIGGGIPGAATYLSAILPRLSESFSPLPDNQSLQAVLARVFSTQEFSYTIIADRFLLRVPALLESPTLLRAGTAVGVGTIALLTLFGIGRLGTRRATGEGFAVALSLMLAALVIVTPIVWDHYYVLLAVPLAVLWRHRSCLGPWVSAVPLLVGVLVGIQRLWRAVYLVLPSPLTSLWGFAAALLVWSAILRLALADAPLWQDS